MPFRNWFPRTELKCATGQSSSTLSKWDPVTQWSKVFQLLYLSHVFPSTTFDDISILDSISIWKLMHNGRNFTEKQLQHMYSIWRPYRKLGLLKLLRLSIALRKSHRIFRPTGSSGRSCSQGWEITWPGGSSPLEAIPDLLFPQSYLLFLTVKRKEPWNSGIHLSRRVWTGRVVYK